MTPHTASPADSVLHLERALPAGTRLEEFEIECVLAQGSIGIVYRAYDRVLKLHVAIKEYMPNVLAMRSGELQLALRERAYAPRFEVGRQAFINEARILAHCEHRSLPRILRILQHHGTVYRVMNCCPGPTLHEHRRAMAGTPSEVALRAWLDGLLGALAELHSVGWVHAAVSPGNILMLPGDRPMLLDSDAVHAALISDRTRSMMSELEPCFAPIEQRERASGSPVGPWTDLYSLAATIHFCISGHLPATPASRAVAPLEPLSALWRHLHAGQSRPSHEPSWLRALDACLAESAQDRPQSVAQLRASLDEQHACWLLVSEDMPGQRTTKHSAALGATEQEQTGQDAARAKGLLGLEQTLPFIAARAHEFVAVGHARALSAETAWPLARHRRRPWIGGVVLLLVVAATTGDWVGGGGSSSLAVSTGFASGVANASVQPAPVHAGTEALVILAPAAAMPDSSANAAQVAAAAESPSAANRGTTLTTMATTSQSGSRAPDNPRGLCGTRSGYALYQCMQIQCAKRDWTKHAQCQRLRQHQTLG